MSPNLLPAEDDVLTILRSLCRQKATLKMTKSFKGIVLNQDVSILEINPNCASFRTTSVEMCAALKGYVYLHHRFFPQAVFARLECLDTSKGVFVLSGFAYIDSEWRERQHGRVEPNRPVYVTLHRRGRAFRAILENISVNGMGVSAYKFFEGGMKIQPGSNILLDFQLSPDYKYAALKGTVRYLHVVDSLFVRLGIQLNPKAEEARSLEMYTARRRSEIMEELNWSFTEMSRLRGIESLYF